LIDLKLEKIIIEMLEEQGILVSVEDHQIQIPKGDRSKQF
jgi:valyl-tRNA synthetase